MRVFPNHQMGEQRPGFAGGRQSIESRHRGFHFVTHAVDIDHQKRRLLDRQAALEKADHRRLTERCTETRTLPLSAWQTAVARASAASGDRGPSSLRILFIMSCTWAFSALPDPTTACLICRVAYSNTSAFASAVPQMAAPRACPNFSALSGLRLTNTRSIAISCGRYWATMVCTQRKNSHRRSANSPFWVRITPLATYVNRGPTASRTPKPVRWEPGSMPSTRTLTASAPRKRFARIAGRAGAVFKAHS